MSDERIGDERIGNERANGLRCLPHDAHSSASRAHNIGRNRGKLTQRARGPAACATSDGPPTSRARVGGGRGAVPSSFPRCAAPPRVRRVAAIVAPRSRQRHRALRLHPDLQRGRHRRRAPLAPSHDASRAGRWARLRDRRLRRREHRRHDRRPRTVRARPPAHDAREQHARRPVSRRRCAHPACRRRRPAAHSS